MIESRLIFDIIEWAKLVRHSVFVHMGCCHGVDNLCLTFFFTLLFRWQQPLPLGLQQKVFFLAIVIVLLEWGGPMVRTWRSRSCGGHPVFLPTSFFCCMYAHPSICFLSL